MDGGGVRRREGAYRRSSEESHSLHPSAVRLQTQRWRNQVSTAPRKGWRCCGGANPSPPVNTSVLSSSPPSCHTQLERSHTHTHTHTPSHTHTRLTHPAATHTSSRTATTRKERLKPRQPDSVLTPVAPPLSADRERESEGGGGDT